MTTATPTAAAEMQPPVAVAAQPAATLPMHLINPETLIIKAIETGLPVESLEKLLTMRAELKREAAAAAFAAALTRFQADIPPIPKSKTAGGRYKYADIADIQRAIAPRMAECGLSVTFDTEQPAPDALLVIAIVQHLDGHSQKTRFPVPIDRAARMNDTQKVGSALTYGRRYALTAALGIVTAEEDDDAQALNHRPAPQPAAAAPAPAEVEIISPSQHRLIEAKIGESGIDRERVKNWLSRATGGEVQHLNHLPKSLFNPLLNKLNQFAATATATAAAA